MTKEEFRNLRQGDRIRHKNNRDIFTLTKLMGTCPTVWKMTYSWSCTQDYINEKDCEYYEVIR